MGAQSTTSHARPELARDLGLSHAGAVVVGTIIGSGIFLVPSEMMQAVGSARMVYLAWMAGGLLSFFGALTYAELGAMKPQAGGEYVYVRDAYGPLAGFLYSWTWFLIAKPASIATITTGLVRILETFAVFSFFSRTCLSHPFAVTYGQLVAIAATLVISGLNYIGVRRAGEFQFLFTLLKVAIILGIVAVGFSYSGGTWANFATEFTGARGGLAGFFAALVAALWAYDGWNDLNMVAGEIRNPQRNIPLALIWGVATVGALYILVNAAVQYVLPAAAIASSERPASDAVALVLGHSGARPGFGGHRDFDACHFEWHHHERGARALCDRPRRLFFLGAGGGSSSLSYPVGGDCRAVRAGHCSAATGRQFPAVFFPGHFRRVDVLHDRRQHRIYFSPAGTGPRPALSRVGISHGSGAFLCLLPRLSSTTRSPTTSEVRLAVVWQFWRAFQFSTILPVAGRGPQSNRPSGRRGYGWLLKDTRKRHVYHLPNLQ